MRMQDFCREQARFSDNAEQRTWAQENVGLKSGPRSLDLRPVYTERLRFRDRLKLMMNVNDFYIKIYRKTQMLSLGVRGSLR